jgi:hypothetical protein
VTQIEQNSARIFLKSRDSKQDHSLTEHLSQNKSTMTTTSNSEDHDVATAALPIKKRKPDNDESSLTVTAATATVVVPHHPHPPPPLCFLLPSDLALLTDYFILIFAQVTRVVMSECHKSKGRKGSQIGTLGLRCKHCDGLSRGSCFPSNTKSLSATPLTLHAHMIQCEHVPFDVKRALKLTKSRHKFSAMVKPPGSQSTFFNNLWERVQSPTFTGADRDGLNTIQTEIDFIIEQSKPKPKPVVMPPIVASARKQQQSSMPAAASVVNQSHNHVELPNVVSYDLDNEHNLTFASQALDFEVLNNTTASPPTEEDLEAALELLRQPETPGNHDYLLQSPDMAHAMTPNAVSGLVAPIPTRMSSSGERYHDGKFIVSSNYDDAMNNSSTPRAGTGAGTVYPKEETPRPNNGNVESTRKFTRSDEIHLVRGILEHGKSNWKKIWQETTAIHHIKHSECIISPMSSFMSSYSFSIANIPYSSFFLLL